MINIAIENIEDWTKAGKIASEVRQYGRTLIKEGASLLEVTETVEKKIMQLNGKIAFPVQISRNNIAAHYCPDIEDKTVFQRGDVIKIDVGVHINGCIGDTACTVYLGDDPKIIELVRASEEALESAIKNIRNGIFIGEIGALIQKAISSHGFAPIRNLSGHGLEKFAVHSSPNIPNFATGDRNKVEEQVIAIEPFATNGAGIVVEGTTANVFSLVNKKPVRDNISRAVLKKIDEYEGLPFARRWLEQEFSKPKADFALRQLLRQEIIQQYPPLSDMGKGLVSQAEHTLIVSDKIIVTTL